jgi:DNA (cytosine-5)-methyltransferase 1
MIFYNENDKFVAQWLRNLVKTKRLPVGRVDERDIRQIGLDDVEETSHFFAGIGGWPLALEAAGWPNDVPVWTGSCPCQPFSNAGKRRGISDERHLWPAWARIIRERKPPVVLGEQTASRLGREWLEGVRVDLEEMGYEVGAADLCAAGVGAPHIRQRLFWVGYSGKSRLSISKSENLRREGRWKKGGTAFKSGSAFDFWSNAELLRCTDGRTRRIESSLPAMVDGISLQLADGRTRNDTSRVKTIKAIGNAICVPLAKVFIEAFMDVLNGAGERRG